MKRTVRSTLACGVLMSCFTPVDNGEPSPSSPLSSPPSASRSVQELPDWLKPLEPQQPPAPAPGCAGRTVITKNLMQVLELGADGSQRTIFAFHDESPAPWLNFTDWQARGDFVGGYASTFFAGQWHEEYVVVNRRNTRVVFHRLHDINVDPQVWVGVDGSLSVIEGTSSWVGVPDGTAEGAVVDLSGAFASGPVLGGGVVPVGFSAPADSQPRLDALFVLSTRTLEPLPSPPLDAKAFRFIADRLFYVTKTELIEVGGVAPAHYAGVPSGVTSVVEMHSPEPAQVPDHVLLEQGDQPVAMLDRGSSTIAPLAVDWLGVQANSNYTERLNTYSLELDSDGELLAGFQLGPAYENATQLQLRRSLDLGVTWVDLGAPMPIVSDVNISWLVVRAQGATHMLVSTGSWEPDTHYTYGIQLLTPAGSFSLQPDVATDYGFLSDDEGVSMLAELSDDGTCMATFEVTGPPLASSSGWPEMGQVRVVFVDGAGVTLKGATLPTSSTLRAAR